MRIFSAKRRWWLNICMARVAASCLEIWCQAVMNVATRAKSRDEATIHMTFTSYPPSSNSSNLRKYRILHNLNNSNSHSSRNRNNSNNNSNNQGGHGRCREVLQHQTRTRHPPIKTFVSVQIQNCVVTAARATFGLIAHKEKPCIRQIRRHHQFSWSCRRVIQHIKDSPPMLVVIAEVRALHRPLSSEWTIGSFARETT